MGVVSEASGSSHGEPPPQELGGHGDRDDSAEEGDDDDDDPDPYNCKEGALEDWKKNKRKWCCVVKEIGCQSDDEGSEHAPSGASRQKATNTTTKETTTSTTEDPEADI